MVRWSLAISALLGVIAISVGGLLWVSSGAETTLEGVRQLRMQQQVLQQQYNVLSSKANSSRIINLSQNLDALKIQLVEVVTQKPLPEGVGGVDFEQHVLPSVLESTEPDPVSTLRLVLKLEVQHSVGLINMLDRIKQSMTTWPYEVRACDLQRQPEQQLQSKCIIDFYHWSDESAVVDSTASKYPPRRDS